MLSIKNLKDAAGAGSYFNYDNYYRKNHNFDVSVDGDGAAALELKPEDITPEKLTELLEGKLSDQITIKTARGHRPGTDLTFSAPKSVSIAAFTGDDVTRNDMQTAHNRAVKEALRFVEKECTHTRITENKETRTEQTTNILAVSFIHDTSRELDPQLHTHSLIINATQGKDGKWRALSNEELYNQKMIIGAVYRSALARELQERGYSLEERPKGTFELSGYTDEQLSAFSKRRQQIEKYLDSMGRSSAKDAANATLRTRRSKNIVDHAKLYEAWQKAAEKLQIVQPEKIVTPKRSDKQRAAAESVEFAVQKQSERKSVLTRKELFVEALHDGILSTDYAHIANHIREREHNGDLVQIKKGRYITRETVEREERLIARMKDGKRKHRAITSGKENRAALTAFEERKGFALSSGQRKSAALILGSTDKFVAVEGYAGTGKTTLLEYIREQSEAHGYEIRGYTPSAAAADVLRTETGIPSDTLARHLINQHQPQPGKDPGDTGEKKPELWIVDEAGMVSTRQMDDLFRAAEKQDARVILLGDRKQLSAVEAGSPFAQLIDNGMALSQITEIRRQTVDDRLAAKLRKRGYNTEQIAEAVKRAERLRGAVYEAIEGDIPKALESVQTIEVKDRNDRHQRLVADYKALSPADRAETLIVTATNEDRRNLNSLLRGLYAQEGTLSGEEIKTPILIPRNLEKVALSRAASYTPGDVVRFGLSYKKLGVENGEYAEVIATDPGNRTVTLKTTSGKNVEWKPLIQNRVEVYREEERELQKGDRIRFSRNDKEAGVHNGDIGVIRSLDTMTHVAVVSVAGNDKILDLDRFRHYDHGYAITTHASQGRTCERVLIDIDTNADKLLGTEAFYVDISRARIAETVYTDNIEKLPASLSKSTAQENALPAKKEHAAAQAAIWLNAGSRPQDEPAAPSRERDIGR